MATEIICIVADKSGIQYIGAANWTKDQETVIAEIEEGQEFFLEKEPARFRLIVARDRDDRKYLRTDPDETAENNLLRLPTCP